MTLGTVAHQAPLSTGFSRQQHWSELPFPPPVESFQPRDGTHISCIGRQILYQCATWEAPCFKYSLDKKKIPPTPPNQQESDWGLNSCPLAVEVQNLNHWTTREVPHL